MLTCRHALSRPRIRLDEITEDANISPFTYPIDPGLDFEANLRIQAGETLSFTTKALSKSRVDD
ncbi:MAG: hypothetical protein ACJAZO_001488 [Myxococcota bacterium]|jgi:hypothetical protein